MASPSGPVRLERDGPIAWIHLASPPVNVLARPVLDALAGALSEAEGDPALRVVVLLSDLEKAFAAGANIREMAELTPEGARAHGGRGQALTRQIERLPLPVIAAVDGVCLGGGCEIALACDLIVATPRAAFGQPEIKLGVMPGWGGTRRLPRRIGAAAARRWILTGATVPAEEAHRAGLVDRLVPPDELRGAARALAEELARLPPVALAAAKYALLHAIDPGIDEGLAYELDLWSRLFGTGDQKRGMAAFLSKQPFSVGSREGWARESAGFPWAPGASGAAEGTDRGGGGKRKN
ncbi:MAG: enoyl-CoA hydratase/isomerase family protein [Thermoplasmata archaeon]